MVLLKVTLSVSDRNCRSPDPGTTALPQSITQTPLGSHMVLTWLLEVGALVDAERYGGPHCMTA